MDSPSNVSCHPVLLDRGVTTSWPQPQQHLWMTVENGIETYTTPFSRSSGIWSTNL